MARDLRPILPTVAAAHIALYEAAKLRGERVVFASPPASVPVAGRDRYDRLPADEACAARRHNKERLALLDADRDARLARLARLGRIAEGTTAPGE